MVKSNLQVFTNVMLRIVATFAASGLGVIGAGALAGVSLWKACFMAGIAGVAFVVEGLARSFLDDGKLSLDEINNVFNKVDGRDNEVTTKKRVKKVTTT
jgi:hypothetical protein